MYYNQSNALSKSNFHKEDKKIILGDRDVSQTYLNICIDICKMQNEECTISGNDCYVESIGKNRRGATYQGVVEFINQLNK